MRHLNEYEVTRKRIGKWMLSAKPIDAQPTWTETRLAIDFGGHTFLIGNGQIYQCAKCGHYDPEWSATEVLKYFEETLGIHPYEIEVTCSVAVVGSEKN